MTRAALESAIVAAMDTAAETPMRWGKDDCALWTANILRPVLGYDPAAEWRGKYRTRDGSRRAAGTNGLLGAIRAIARRHHWKRIHPVLAQPGDVGMVWTTYDDKPVLATVICRKRGWFVGRAASGITLLPADRVAMAWSVLPDALATSTPRASLPSLRREMVPTSAACHEPISTGLAILSLLGITGASTFVAGVVGAVVLGTLSVAVSKSSSLI